MRLRLQRLTEEVLPGGAKLGKPPHACVRRPNHRRQRPAAGHPRGIGEGPRGAAACGGAAARPAGAQRGQGAPVLSPPQPAGWQQGWAGAACCACCAGSVMPCQRPCMHASDPISLGACRPAQGAWHGRLRSGPRGRRARPPAHSRRRHPQSRWAGLGRQRACCPRTLCRLPIDARSMQCLGSRWEQPKLCEKRD